MDKQVLNESQKFARILKEINIEQAFDGKFYNTTTRLKKNTIPTSLIKSNKPRFIAGYVYKNRRIFFEIWYYPKHSSYKILDNFGRVVKERFGDAKGYRSLNDAVDDLMYIIDQEEPEVEYDDTSISRLSDEFIRGGYARRANVNEGIDVECLLSESVVTRSALHTMINDEIEEYKDTRVWKYKKNPIIRMFLGRKVLPTDYRDNALIASVKKIINANRDIQFVTGYTLKNRIDIEIWYMKQGKFGTDDIRGGFYVFDLTAGKIVAEGLTSLRWAIYEVAKKIGTLDSRSSSEVIDAEVKRIEYKRRG